MLLSSPVIISLLAMIPALLCGTIGGLVHKHWKKRLKMWLLLYATAWLTLYIDASVIRGPLMVLGLLFSLLLVLPEFGKRDKAPTA